MNRRQFIAGALAAPVVGRLPRKQRRKLSKAERRAMALRLMDQQWAKIREQAEAAMLGLILYGGAIEHGPAGFRHVAREELCGAEPVAEERKARLLRYADLFGKPDSDGGPLAG